MATKYYSQQHHWNLLVVAVAILSQAGCGEGTQSPSSKDKVVASSNATVGSAARIFVTSALYSGNLGGLAGADAKCQALATGAGLDGTYKAWLSDDTTTASARLAHSTVPYVRVDGTVIASDWSQLTSGFLTNAIMKTETNTAPPFTNSACVGGPGPIVWTGTNSDGLRSGTPFFIQNCAGWSANGTIALVGRASLTNSGWTNECSFQQCNTEVAALYCIQQPCHYFVGTVIPSTTKRGSTVSISATLKNCAQTQQSLTFAITGTFTGPSTDSCAPSMRGGSFPVTLPAGFSQSASFPFTVAADACIGSYSVSVTTYLNGVPIAVDNTSTTLNVQP
jgi:hypothetical protein